MKTKLTAVLLLFSIILFVLGYYTLYTLNRAASELTPVRTVSTQELRSQFKRAKTNPVTQRQTAAFETKVVYVTNQFHWSQVESGDYREYIANLRGIGCPENTIRDIILTDVLKLYASQRGQSYNNGREFRFWESDEKRKLNAKQLEQQERQLALIDKELPAVLRELLGINYEREMNKYFVDKNEDERRLNFLSEDKRNQLLALRDQIEGQKERVLEKANGNLSAADTEELRKIETQRKALLENLLTDSELAEFELRTSTTADRLRTELIGFNASESEFREIFALHNSVEDRFAFAGSKEEKAAAQKVVEAEIQRQLGDARYAEYIRAQNPDFRNATIFAEVYELPASTAQSLFEIKQIAETEMQNVLANSTIQDSERQEALNAIQAETEKVLRETLGVNVFSKYSQGTGKWVQNLGAN